MKQWKSILLLIIVFCAGVAAGVVGTRTAMRHFMRQAMSQPERAQNFVERDLAWKLHLEQPQRVKLHEVLVETRGQLHDLRQQIQPQTILIVSNANAQIAAMLTPEQQAVFEQFKQDNILFARPPYQPKPAHQPRN
jgi:hypothetical protein